LARKTRTPVAEVPVEEPTETTEEAPEIRPEPTLADRFVGINSLIVNERRRTRLSEATLVKSFEVALQFHAWQTQMDAQQRQQFDPKMFGIDTENPIDPEEYVGPAIVAETEQETD
jgi:hypothetical protein